MTDLKFDNRFFEELPGDTGPAHEPRTTSRVSYARVEPTPVLEPELVIWSAEAGTLLDLAEPKDSKGEEALIFSGNQLLKGASPYATRYGGHQFGHWAGQLGDGRAISLGEVINKKGQRWEVQLKGAGLTPYSRTADGRAVLRSSLREFLCSEAMSHLGVPTTRALCLVKTGEPVLRDMFYDGNVLPEPGAIVTRLAPTFLRFGHYQIHAANSEDDLLKSLVEYTLKYHFPEITGSFEQKLISWFEEVCVRTAGLMVEWLRVGFVHGVMNTDNMSILGLTIDYGPYGWLDVYDPHWTPNTTDTQRRYAFGQQPAVAFWNLNQLANALAVLVSDTQGLVKGLELYKVSFSATFAMMIAGKLGLQNLNDVEDKMLVQQLDAALQASEIDMTIFYRQLAHLHGHVGDLSGETFMKTMGAAFYSATPDEKSVRQLKVWTEGYLRRCVQDTRPIAEIKTLMNSTNPVFILRNYLVQQALDELAEGQRGLLDALMKALKTPYELNSATSAFVGKRPEWARTKAGCAALSCSS
ncbi:MAG: YdiU family protein [Bdellovibrionales bacterium]